MDSKTTFEVFLLKEIFSFKDFSINTAINFNYAGATLGYSPNILNKSIEVHGGVFNSWEDTFNFKFNPVFGVGISIKF